MVFSVNVTKKKKKVPFRATTDEEGSPVKSKKESTDMLLDYAKNMFKFIDSVKHRAVVRK